MHIYERFAASLFAVIAALLLVSTLGETQVYRNGSLQLGAGEVQITGVTANRLLKSDSNGNLADSLLSDDGAKLEADGENVEGLLILDNSSTGDHTNIPAANRGTLLLRAGNANRALNLQQTQDASLGNGDRANIAWWSNAGERLAEITAHANTHNHFSLYTKDDAPGSGNTSPQKRLDVTFGPSATATWKNLASWSLNSAPMILANGSLSIGTNYSTSGAVRLANDAVIMARNAANNADLELIKLNSSNAVNVGRNASPVVIGGNADGQRLAWGALLSTRPSLKNVGTALQVRLGDDSGYAAIDAGQIKINGSEVKTVSTFTSDDTYDPTTLGTGASRTDSVAVTGLVAGRALICNPGGDITPGSCIYNCWTDTNDTASIHWYNGDDGVGGSNCNPTLSTWVFMQPAS